MVFSLRYMHQKNVTHGDIKLENILLMNKQKDRYFIKIVDFGLATETENFPSIGGTLSYCPPEFFQEYRSKRTNKVQPCHITR